MIPSAVSTGLPSRRTACRAVGLKRAGTAESAFLHGPKAQNRPGSFSLSKPLIISRISGRGKKFAVAVMGEVREVREACPKGSWLHNRTI
ncbi:MAG: hypothetical protein LBV50_11520, partial [Novosphingobium sp.]|nr:hypothetical protein [Novosphingobium sp.]